MSDKSAQHAEVAPSTRAMADALRTLAASIEFHERRGRLMGDLTYTIRQMLAAGVVPEEYADILRRHLARIDGPMPRCDEPGFGIGKLHTDGADHG